MMASRAMMDDAMMDDPKAERTPDMAIQILTILTMLAALPVLLLTTAGCGQRDDSISDSGRQVDVVVTAARRAEVPNYVAATGNLAAEKTVMVSTRMMGWIKRIHVEEGRPVSKGDSLVSIDATDLIAKQAAVEAAIAEAKAVLANAQTMVDRFEKLYADESVSRQQLDDVLTGRDRAAAALARARANLSEIDVNLSYLEIMAPIDGIIARKMVEEGDMANPGMPLIVLEQADRMKVVAHVGEKDVGKVRVGEPIEVDVTSLPGAVFTVPVARLIPAANPGSRTYDLEAYIENSDGNLRSGMFARVRIRTGRRQTILAATAAVIRRGQLTGFWIVREDRRTHLRWVRLGSHFGNEVEVLSGLSGDETLVLSHTQPLAEGDIAVVTKHAPTETAMRQVGDGGFGPYCVQIGTFLLPEDAQRRVAELAEIGVTATLVIAPADGKIYQRVYVPNLADAEEAKALGQRVESELGFAYLVRKEN